MSTSGHRQPTVQDINSLVIGTKPIGATASQRTGTDTRRIGQLIHLEPPAPRGRLSPQADAFSVTGDDGKPAQLGPHSSGQRIR